MNENPPTILDDRQRRNLEARMRGAESFMALLAVAGMVAFVAIAVGVLL